MAQGPKQGAKGALEAHHGLEQGSPSQARPWETGSSNGVADPQDTRRI